MNAPEGAAARQGGGWIGVASADHVRRGLAGGFMQICHGKGGPLRRIAPGERVAYYSPATSMGGKDRLQSFTALGRAREGAPYQVEISEGFHPFRRDVEWEEAQDAPIAPLLDALEFTRGRRNWGYAFRFGILRVSQEDMDTIAAAMQRK